MTIMMYILFGIVIGMIITGALCETPKPVGLKLTYMGKVYRIIEVCQVTYSDGSKGLSCDAIEIERTEQ